jgi:hypothetical protein
LVPDRHKAISRRSNWQLDKGIKLAEKQTGLGLGGG